jgi:antitoxin component YwqK of YwqJK toxin-antitoxin module
MRSSNSLAAMITTCFALAIALCLATHTSSRAADHRQHGASAPATFTPTPTLAYDDNAQDSDTALAQPIGPEGAVETIRERYDDGKVKIERQVTLDADGNYVNHGEWKMLSHNGDVVAEGHYDMGKRVGTWTRWHGRQDSSELSEFPFNRFKAPLQSQANFVNDTLEGEWVITDAAQRKCFEASLIGGKRSGTVTYYLPTGKTYRQSTYDNGIPTGDVLEADRNGELKTAATYIDGRKAVTKTTYFHGTRHKMSETSYLAATTVERTPDDFWNLGFAAYGSDGEDLRHGPAKTWFENGVVQQEGTYQYDKKSGNFTYRYENGQVAVTGEYRNDVPDDVWVWWHENGQKAAIGKYQEGALIGEWRWWNDDGKLAQQKTYDGTQTAGSEPQEIIKLGRAPSQQQSK